MVVLPFSTAADTADPPRSAKPSIIRRRLRNAPAHAPCPHCGQRAARKRFCQRTVTGIAYHAIVRIDVTTGEYAATCTCCATFRTQVDGIEAKADYSNQVREAVLDRLLDDHMSLHQIQECLRRDFHLDLSTGFLYDCLDWKLRQVDAAAYRQWTLAHFSGTLCIDELHLGRRTLLLATDPLNDFPVAFALVSRNDQEHMERFLRHLSLHGFRPRVVVTDGSSLYPKLLAALWPEARHQLCVFHVLQDINKHVLDAVRREQRRLQRQGRKGRRRRRGRPRAQQQRRRRGPTLREKAHYVFKHRHVLTKRWEHLTFADHKVLRTLLEYAPGLRVLRAFVDEIHELLAAEQTAEQARGRLAQLRQRPDYANDPHLAKVVALLEPERFEKMIAYLHSPLGERVRTNNHVERANRELRHYEKVRYRWRQRRTIVRFVVLLLSRRWQQRRAAAAGTGAHKAESPPPNRAARLHHPEVTNEASVA
jgi:hypothetical protein